MKCKLIVIVFLINSLSGFCQEKDVKPYKVLKGHEHKVQNAFYSPDGKYLIAGTPESNILIWDMELLLEP